MPARVTSVEGLKRAITNKRGFTTSREILIVAVPAKVKYLCEDLRTVSCCSALWARILGVARSSSTCLKAVKTVWRYLAMVVHVVLEYNRFAVETGGGTRTEFDGFSLLETTSEEPQTLRLEFLPIPGEIVVFGLVRASKYRIKLGVFRCLCY